MKRLYAKPKLDWVARVLARAGALPLARAEEAVREGRVTVGGRTVHQPLAAVQPGEAVCLDGVPVGTVRHTRVLAFHKPRGVVTSTVDPTRQGTVFERLAAVLPPELAGYSWHAVGRLDRDTTGLLLFTNDEALLAHVTSPDTRLPKRYHARVQGRPTPERLAPIQAGMRLGALVTRPAQARVVGPHEVELTLTEGKNHQVKRMLGALGFPVVALARVGVGSLTLDLPEGAVRELSPAEVATALRFPLEPPSGP